VANVETLLSYLVKHFDYTVDVTKRTDLVRGAAGDNVRIATSGAHLVRHLLHGRLEIRTTRVLTQIGVKDAVKQYVA
jgi:hypothetical protein